MATDSEQLVLSISAETAQIHRALKRLQKGFDDLKPPKMEIPPSVGRSIKNVSNDAKVLSFQLNDIATGLSTGQSPFTVLNQQLGQITQTLGGQGVLGALGVLRGALATAWPTLALLAATTALQYYFSEAEDGSEEANKEIKKQRDLIRDVAKEWGDALPALKEYNDELERQEGIQKALGALAEATAKATEEITKAFDASAIQRMDDVFSAFARFPKYAEEIKTWREEWESVQKAIAAGTLSGEEYAAFQARTNDLLAKLPAGALVKIQEHWLKAQTAIEGNIERVQQLTEETKKFGDAVGDAVNKMVPMPGMLAPLTSGAGVFNPSQTQLDIASGNADVELTRAMLKTKAANKTIAASLDNLTDEAVKAFGKLFSILPETARITSGVRSRAQQAELYADYKSGRGGLAAPPGHSKHEIGAALDIGEGVDMETLRQAVAATAELTNLKGKAYEVDKVHVQLKSAAKAIDEEAARTAEQEAEATQRKIEKYNELLAATQKKIDLQLRENEINDDHTKSETEKSFAIQQETLLRELNNQAIENGIPLTAQVIAQHEQLARSMALAGLAADQLKVAQKESAQSAKEQADAIKQFNTQIANMAQSAISGLVNDLRNGVEAGEAFKNMLNRILDSLIQIGIQSLFGGAGGGIFGSWFGVPAAASGGIVGQSITGHRNVSPFVFAGAPRFATGGMVGLRPGEVPIIAHRGEMIIPANMVGKGGGTGRGGNTYSMDNARISIDMAQTGLVAANNDDAKEFGRNVQKLIQAEMVRESRPGGLLRRAN